MKGNGVLFLNGTAEKKVEVSKDDLIVCADGAYTWVKKLKIVPDVVLGDFDSLHHIPNDVSFERYDSDKDKTDGEIGMRFLLKHKIGNIEIWGGFGKRSDHFLTNLHLLKIAKNKGAFAVMRGSEENCFLASGKVVFFTKVNSIVSVTPFGGDVHILSSEGLKFPLNALTLTSCDTIGVSNVATSAKVELNIEWGEALIFVENWRSMK